MVAVPRTMTAVRLHAPGVDGLRRETIATPSVQLGEALVEVHAAAITRDELEASRTVGPRELRSAFIQARLGGDDPTAPGSPAL